MTYQFNPKETLERLNNLRYSYSDEIPSEIISNQGKYKVRNAWFNSVSLIAQELSETTPFSERTNLTYQYFLKQKRERDMRNRITQEKDILAGNDLLEQLIIEVNEHLLERTNLVQVLRNYPAQKG